MANNELVASVPFTTGRKIEYCKDRIIFDNKEVYYEDITGYGYSLISQSQSVNLIPTANSKTVSLSISVGNDKKPIVFSETISMPMRFHSQKQADLDVIFSEIIKITNALLFEFIFSKLYRQVYEGGSVNIGGLMINKDSIRRKGIFKEIELEKYGRTYLQSGLVVVEGGDGRTFFSTSIGDINAPLLSPLLDTFFKN